METKETDDEDDEMDDLNDWISCECPNYRDFCLCLSSDFEEESRFLAGEDCSFIETSPEPALVPNSRLTFHDRDTIDFNFIKSNWWSVRTNQTTFHDQGIRSLCKKLTVKMFDEWCEETKDESK